MKLKTKIIGKNNETKLTLCKDFLKWKICCKTNKISEKLQIANIRNETEYITTFPADIMGIIKECHIKFYAHKYTS